MACFDVCVLKESSGYCVEVHHRGDKKKQDEETGGYGKTGNVLDERSIKGVDKRRQANIFVVQMIRVYRGEILNYYSWEGPAGTYPVKTIVC